MACVRGAVTNPQPGAIGRNHNKLGRFATFTTRARNAGVELDPDNPENLSEIAKQVAGDVVTGQAQRTGYRLLMWNVWTFFEDPTSSIAVRSPPRLTGAVRRPCRAPSPPLCWQAKYFSFLMMSTIILSILNFCLETLPDCQWIDHMRLCKEREEDASPWFEIEAVCIVIFTGEFVLRILASPEGERQNGGVVAFCKNGANIIDFVRTASACAASTIERARFFALATTAAWAASRAAPDCMRPHVRIPAAATLRGVSRPT